MIGSGKEGEHPLRCETCDYRYHHDSGKCPYDREEVYYLLKEEMRLPRAAWLFTSVLGCASHSSSQQAGKTAEQRIAEVIAELAGFYNASRR